MATSVNKLVDRPRLAKARAREAYWLVLDPHRTGMAGGAFFAWMAAAVYGLLALVRWEPLFGPPQLVSVALTFVIGYAGVGLFVIYLLRIGEREFPLPEHAGRIRKKKRDGDAEGMLPEEILDENGVLPTGEAHFPGDGMEPDVIQEIPVHDE